MGFDDLHDILSDIAVSINAGNSLPTSASLMSQFPQLAQLATEPELSRHFVTIDNGVTVPRVVESLRLLFNLKQRWSATHPGNPLVGRYRFDPLKRVRPIRNLDRSRPGDLNLDQQQIASYSPFDTFSSYQVEGWGKVWDSLETKGGMVITAPTGAGKTEVFLLPLVHRIAQAKTRGTNEQYILIYPRVALLKDQLARVLLYTYFSGLKGQKITVGFQFDGVTESDSGTASNRSIFDDQMNFLPVQECPVCSSRHQNGQLYLKSEPSDRANKVQILGCRTCDATFPVTISRQGHSIAKPSLLVTTAESLDSFYLKPKQEEYLKGLDGILIDEAHLFESLYGVHIYHVLRRVQNMVRELSGKNLTKIAASATIGDAKNFISKLFYGQYQASLQSHELNPSQHPCVTDGLECFISLQSQPTSRSSAPVLIQAVMAMGHGILRENEIQVAFIDSIDGSTRIAEQVRNADETRRLWEWRTIQSDIQYINDRCQNTNPGNCKLHNNGECWRGVLGGTACLRPIPLQRERALDIQTINSQTSSDLGNLDVAVATPTLEVGVDDTRIKAVIQYGSPRSLAGLTQRRGRAGRSGGEIALSLMVLANTDSDNFALYRRKRMLESSFNLPLNPGNPVLIEMHDRIEAERRRFGQLYTKHSNQPKAAFAWLLALFDACPTLKSRYRTFIGDLRSILQSSQFRPEDVREIQKRLRAWVKAGLDEARPVLEIRECLQILAEDFPSQLQHVVDLVQAGIDDFLAGNGNLDAISDQLLIINDDLVRLARPPTPQDVSREYRDLGKRILDLNGTLYNYSGTGSVAEYERLYSFFRELEDWLRPLNNGVCYALNVPQKDIKVILRAMFYLHDGIQTGHECDGTCPSRINSLVPLSYFTTVKPVRYAVRGYGLNSPAEIKEEPISTLVNFFYPYRLQYRYGQNRLDTIATQHSPEWVQGNQVEVHLPVIGVDLGDSVVPQQVPVRQVNTDDGGRQIVRLCMGCYKVHNLRTRLNSCCPGFPLEPVSLFSSPVVGTDFRHTPNTCEKVSNSLYIASGQSGTTIYGANVSATKYISVAQQNGQREWMPSRSQPFDFSARYRQPLSFTTRTKAIGWGLKNIVEDILKQMTSISEDEILITAASLLRKVVAAVAGVRSDTLQSSLSKNQHIWVAETVEGGAGISELFIETLRVDPLRIYREMVRTVLCPVGLAETAILQGSSITSVKSTIESRFLPSNDETVQAVIGDVSAEYHSMQVQASSGETLMGTCSANDGCPVCLNNELVSRNGTKPSRSLAENILERLVKVIDRQAFEQGMENADVPGSLPRLLWIDGDRYYVLVL